ncbi:hypothetical protein V1280_005421 [Bradyrhizobium sp. AZCC 2230]
MPFHIGALPEHLPVLLTLVVGRFRDRLFDRPAFLAPMGADRIYLDALALDPERQVKLGAEMRRWSSLLDEFSDQLLATLYSEF